MSADLRPILSPMTIGEMVVYLRDWAKCYSEDSRAARAIREQIAKLEECQPRNLRPGSITQ